MNFDQNFELQLTLNYFFELWLPSFEFNPLNYSETYFELDSEETTHCDHYHLIHIKGLVKMVTTKDQSNAIVYGIFFVNTVNTNIKARNVLNAMFVETVDNTGVCGSYTTPYTEYYEVWKLCIKWPLAPARREGYLLQYSIWKAFHLVGLAVHQSVWGGSFVNFLGLVKLQGWLQARCTANPQFLKLRGVAQQPSNS